MKGQELEDLRIQLNDTVDNFSNTIGISAIEYNNQVRKDSIQDAGIITKVHGLELKIERDKLENFGRALSVQPTGPFSKGKIFAHLREIAKLKDDPQQTAPITVEWHLSNKCSHDCPFCTFRESVHAGPNRYATFPDNLVDQTIKDLKEIGSKAVVYSGGGEPLLYKTVDEVMNKVKDAGIRQGLITNGTNIDDTKVADAIIQNLEWIRISVDAGSQEVYEKMHGERCDFARIKDNIKQLVQRRNGTRPTIGVSFLLTMTNFTDLIPSACLFKDIGVDYFQVKPIVITAEERLASGNIFWRTGIFDQLIALPSQATPRYNVYTLGFKFVDMMKAVDKRQFNKCYGHPFYPVISATGAVYVCCLMIGKPGLCYGTLSQDMSFKELWYSFQRSKIGESVNVRDCPVNCKLSETNKALEQILGTSYDNEEFLN